ncbi:MAG: GGDEF domain-containing protein [bacterium]
MSNSRTSDRPPKTYLGLLQHYLDKYLRFAGASELELRRFRLASHEIALKRIRILMIAIGFLAFFFWPEDYFLNKPTELVVAFAYWRSFTILMALVGIIGLQYLGALRKRPNATFALFTFADMIVAGYFLGSVETLDYPWFDFLVFLVPMFSLVMSIDFLTRIYVTNLWIATYVASWIIGSGGTVNTTTVLGSISLWLMVTLPISVIGHSLYYFDFLAYRDERELQRQKQEIKRLANYDQLTGLPTRSKFEELASVHLNRRETGAPPLTLAMIDIDHFKNINDTYGHSAGDDVLRRLGNLIADETRSKDHSCRYGGEEFCVLMPETDEESARHLMTRLSNGLSQQKFSGKSGSTFEITCSIGLAEYDSGIDSIETFYRRADKALYRAKDSGRNKIKTFRN